VRFALGKLLTQPRQLLLQLPLLGFLGYAFGHLLRFALVSGQ
jgi:hypothetical protein